MSSPRVLLTGAAGFIGSQVARVLVDAGCDVQALVRQGGDQSRLAGFGTRLSVIEGDLGTPSCLAMLQRLEPEMCLHLAWYAEPGGYLHAPAENLAALQAGLGLVEVLARAGCRRLVVAGTCAEYGRAEGNVAFDEAASTQPMSAYARAKAALYLGAQDVAEAAGMNLAWARLFFMYGPGEHPSRIVPAVIRAALVGEVFSATAGGQVRDYLHVADVAAALWSLTTSSMLGVVNVCSGRPVTLRRLLEEAEQAAGAEGTVRFGELAYRSEEWMWMYGTNDRLQELGWRPVFDLQSGIRHTVDWWRQRLVCTSVPGTASG